MNLNVENNNEEKIAKNLILGIDQSLTSTGLVLLDRDGALVHHQVVRTKPDTSDPYELYERIQTICDAIRKLDRHYQITTVVIEGLSFAATGRATRDLAGLHAVIVMMLRNFTLAKSGSSVSDVRIVAPTALKKAATGRGAASKEEMLEAVLEPLKSIFEAFPKSGGRYDLADAYHLAKCAIDDVQHSKPAQRDKVKTKSLKIKN